MLREFARTSRFPPRVSMLSFAEKQLWRSVKAVSTDAKLSSWRTDGRALPPQSSGCTTRCAGSGTRIGSLLLARADDIFTIGESHGASRRNVVGTRDVAKTTREELVR